MGEVATLNLRCEGAIRSISARGEFVTLFKVMNVLLRSHWTPTPPNVPFDDVRGVHMGFHSFGVGGNPNIVPALARLIRVERFVSLFVDSYLGLNRGVWALRDLETELVDMLYSSHVRPAVDDVTTHVSKTCNVAVDGDPNEIAIDADDGEQTSTSAAAAKTVGRKFDDYGVGPLRAHPRVATFFGTSQVSTSSSNLTSLDVFRHYCDYIARGATKIAESEDVDDSTSTSFYRYLLDTTRCPSIHYLGIRISTTFLQDSVDTRGVSDLDERQIVAHAMNARNRRLHAHMQRIREEHREELSCERADLREKKNAKTENKGTGGTVVVPTLRQPPRPLSARFLSACQAAWASKSPYSPSYTQLKQIVRGVLEKLDVHPPTTPSQSTSSDRSRKRRRRHQSEGSGFVNRCDKRGHAPLNGERNIDARSCIVGDVATEYAMLFLGGSRYRRKRMDFTGATSWPTSATTFDASKKNALKVCESPRTRGGGSSSSDNSSNDEEGNSSSGSAENDDDDDDGGGDGGGGGGETLAPGQGGVEASEARSEGHESNPVSDSIDGTQAAAVTTNSKRAKRKYEPGIVILKNEDDEEETQLGTLDCRNLRLGRMTRRSLQIIGPEMLRHCLPSLLTSSGTRNMSDREIGRWGEALVYQYLLRLVASGRGGSVEWMNMNGESKISYDLKLMHSSRAHSKTIFIEVKSTRYADKNVFYFTPSEWAYAKQLGDSYHIYRVFNAGTRDAWIAIVTNPNEKLEQREICLCIALP